MSFIQARADVSDCNIGEVTQIWQSVVVRKGADCNIFANALIEGDEVIGDRVKIRSGVQIHGGPVIKDDISFGPNATFTN